MISKPVVAALTLAPLLITFFLRRKINDISNNYDNSYYKCKFISVTMNSECRQHIYDKVPCYAGCSLILLNEIIDFVSSATKSVSVCMYLLTSYEICNVILNCHTSGKQVRVIADERMWGCTGSQARILQRHGIQVKAQKSDGSMLHHKFFLIDEDTPNAKIFIGTINLTLQGLCANWEAIVYTDDKQLIARLKTEFEIMWSDFSIFKRPELGNKTQH